MAKNAESAERLRVASDPTTPRAALADLAYDYPEVRVAIAGNPSTYPGLLDWLRELDDADINAAIGARSDTATSTPPATTKQPATDTVTVIPDAPKAAESTKTTPTTGAVGIATSAIAAQAPAQACAHCGAVLGPVAAFCGSCGTKVPGRVSVYRAFIRAFHRKPVFAFAAVVAVVVFVGLSGGIAAAAGLTSARQAADDQANGLSGDDGYSSDADSSSGSDSTRVSGEPATLPDCPTGLNPVSFSTWTSGNGATLVCGGGGSTVTVVMILGGKTYTSATGTTTPTGYHAEFGGNLSVDIGLGGWATWVGNGGTTTLHAASSGWQTGNDQTQTYPALNSGVKACPTGTYALSLSTWNGGWLLTCGENASETTRFVYVDGSAHGSGHTMTAQGGQSCGSSSSGLQVCVSANPAVVTFSTQGGSQKQHSVDANYVVGEGFSGAGKGTGAYGLADPRANAASQVAYLNGILQQSQAARSSVRGVIQNILKCTSGQGDVQSAQAVVDDRTTELQALNSAPVDAITGGSALVAQLQGVLQDSLTADQAYVTAASQVANGQCPEGRSTYNAQQGLIAQITSEKTAFTNAWNGQIASQYGTPTYTQADI